MKGPLSPGSGLHSLLLYGVGVDSTPARRVAYLPSLALGLPAGLHLGTSTLLFESAKALLGRDLWLKPPQH